MTYQQHLIKRRKLYALICKLSEKLEKLDEDGEYLYLEYIKERDD